MIYVGRVLGSAMPREVSWEQIQFLLGHVSVQTTECYLGCKQRIRAAVNDRIGSSPAPKGARRFRKDGRLHAREPLGKATRFGE
jgi:hypothetical protein